MHYLCKFMLNFRTDFLNFYKDDGINGEVGAYALFFFAFLFHQLLIYLKGLFAHKVKRVFANN